MTPEKVAIVDGLKGSIHILADFVRSVPPEERSLRRGDGFWTLSEHVCHLAQVQPMLLERLQRFSAEEHPSFIPYLPAEEDKQEWLPPDIEMAEAVQSFERFRNTQLAVIDKAGDGVWQKTGIHPEYEQYSFRILVRHILMHDHWHMYRMEELWLTRDAYLTTLV